MKVSVLNKLCILGLLLTFSLALNAGEKVFCSLCAKEMDAGYVKFKDGDVFCSSCMQLPKCIQCGKPTNNIQDGRPLCRRCGVEPNVCGLCGKLVGRSFIVFPLSKKKFCKECTHDSPRCRFCSAPTNEKAEYGLKWAMCGECKGRAIVGATATKEILSEVEAILQSNIHLTLASEAGLEVCDDIADEGRGMNGDEMGLMQMLGRTCVILIQDGMPVEVVYLTLAHEWAHAWVAQNAKYKLDTKTEEGFCQWVASKVLIEKGYDASLNTLRNRNDLYGVGYRKIEKIEIARGVDGVLRYITNSKPSFFKKLFGKKK